VVAATTTSFVFALIAVGLRLYARIALVKKLYGEDYILTTSFVVACSWWVVKVIGESVPDAGSLCRSRNALHFDMPKLLTTSSACLGSVKNDDADIHLLAIVSRFSLPLAILAVSFLYQ